MAPPAVPKSRVLPSKETAAFRDLLHLYETRQLKKALKTADGILKKHPEHGETQCMKALVLVHLGRRDDGRDLVRRGIRNDLTSHIVWHVFGLIQKADKDYDGALKSYAQALRIEPDNQNILRDAAHLQSQLRLFEALVDSRRALLRLRPNLRQNWLALAVALHLHGDPAGAAAVLDGFERALKNVPEHDVEHSELLLYHARLLEDAGEHAQALAFLDSHADRDAIVDQVVLAEARARLIAVTGPPEAAESAWRALLRQNAENVAYYRGLLRARGIPDFILDTPTPSESPLQSSSESTAALDLLLDIRAAYPRAATPRLLALTAAPASAPQFAELARAHIEAGLRKGVPSLFASTKALYADAAKRDAIAAIVEGALASASSSATSANTEEGADVDAPTIYLWAHYYLAQHHSYLGAHTHALTLVNTALAHTPTLPELYTLRARILKRLGDLVGAADDADAARLLDGQDRFLNTKAAKYRFRAGNVEGAADVLGLFTKKDATSPGADLEEMQSALYLLESGRAEARRGRLHVALKRFHAVERVFADVEDDQYDFHGYSIRRSIVNVYIEMIRWADKLRAHPAYVTAALEATEIYIRVHDDPELPKRILAAGAADEKKAKKKAKKAALKAQEAVKQAANANANEDKGLEAQPAKDDDPDGVKLLSDAAPLDRAWRLLAPLRTLASADVRVWTAVYDVAARRGKLLLAAQALNRAKTLDAPHWDLYSRLLHFQLTTSRAPSPLPPAITETLDALLPGAPAGEIYNAQYLQQHSRDARAIVAAARGARVLGAPADEVAGIALGALGEDVEMDIPTARAALAFLEQIGAPRADEFRRGCDVRFKLSTVFKTPDELAAHRSTGVPIEDVELVA